MKKKVVHILSHLKMGGAENLVTNYALKINKEKFEFTIITMSTRNYSFNEEILENAGIKVIYIGNEFRNKGNENVINRFINKVRRYKTLKKHLDELKPDIIHSHLSVNEYLMFVNTKGSKLYHTLHNEINMLFRKEKWLYKISTLYCIKVKNMIPIALHSKMKDEANNLFKTNKTIVLYNGIDLDQFKNKKIDKKIKKRELNIREDRFIIGHVGRFCKQKNHKFLIDIFARVKQINKDSHLILIGIGELVEEVQKQIKLLNLSESVTLLGNRSDISELMSIMDVFLFPSLYEGFPIVLLEAQSIGTKCVVSDTITKDIILNNNIISLSLNESIEKWSECILANHTNIEKNKDLEKYDINNIVKELEKKYLEIND